jgi:hypothetical protein
MAAETITPAAFGELRRLVSLRPSYGTDNTVGPGEAGAATTWTITFVVTLGASPSLTTITENFVAA